MINTAQLAIAVDTRTKERASDGESSSFDEEYLLASLLEAMDASYEYTRDDLKELLVKHLGYRSVEPEFGKWVARVARLGLERGVLAKEGKWVWRVW